ncbi:HNH endonuclease [Archaeoglobus sp.]
MKLKEAIEKYVEYFEQRNTSKTVNFWWIKEHPELLDLDIYEITDEIIKKIVDKYGEAAKLNFKKCVVFARDNYTCVYCKRSLVQYPNLELHLDHKLPKSRYGGDKLSNLVCSCGFCNRAKSVRTAEEFLEELKQVALSVVKAYRLEIL